MSRVVDAVAVGILILAVAAFVPSLVDGTQADKTETVEIQNNTQYEITDKLFVSIEDVSPGTNASVRAVQGDTLNDTTQVLNISQSKVYTLDSENVTINLDDTRESGRGDFAQVTVTYPSTFGFSSGAKLFIGNIEIVVVMIGFIVVMGALGVAIKI